MSPTVRPADRRVVRRAVGESPAAASLTPSVEAELVALDVLHHDARLVVVIGQQSSHVCRAESDQPGAFRLERGQALLADQPGADPYVEMQPVLDDLAL